MLSSTSLLQCILPCAAHPQEKALWLIMLQNLLNKFKLLHLFSHMQMLFCCLLHPYFSFYLWASPDHCTSPKNGWKHPSPQLHSPTASYHKSDQQELGGKIKAQMPKTSQATAKLNNFRGRSKQHIPAQIFWWSQLRDSTSPSSGP